MAEVEITYKGSSIAAMNASGTKTLGTAGKYCEGDIEVEYTRPSAPTPTLQSKTVSPSTSQQTVSPDSGYDGLSQVTVNAMPSGSATTPATTITANPTISVSASGLISATASASQSVTPTVSAGYVSSGTAGTITVSGSNTSQLSTQSAVTATPTESEQTIVSAGKYTTGSIKVGAISSTYVGSGITRRDSTDLTASGSTVSVPSGYYAEAVSKSVASGTAGTPTATKGTVSNHFVSVTPSVTNTTGYITGGTKTGTAVTVSASELVSGTKSITENGTGIDVANYATVDVNVSGGGGTPTLQSKTVSPTGSQQIITADSGYDGLDTVTVNPITLKIGVLLPAAELIQTYSYDKYIVQDEGVTIPAYSTSAQKLKLSESLTPTLNLDLNNYDYYVLERFLTIPTYNTTTKQKGRLVYQIYAISYEIISHPGGTFKDGNTSDATRMTTNVNAAGGGRCVYWVSGTTVTTIAGNNGAYQSVTSPIISSTSSSTPKLTLKSPMLYIKGSTFIFTSDVWSTLTDIRNQYKIEVYRIPKSTYNLDGWNLTTQLDRLIECANSSSQDLT